MRAKEIERLVSRVTKVSIKQMHVKRGDADQCEARSIAWYLRKKYLKHSYNMMSKEYGHKNHTSVRKGVLNVIDHIETEKDLRELVALLERMVEIRLNKITVDKKRYNDHYFLKSKGVGLDAKLKLVYLTEESLNELNKVSKKTVSRLSSNGYGVQFEIQVNLTPASPDRRGAKKEKLVRKQIKKTDYAKMPGLFDGM